MEKTLLVGIRRAGIEKRDIDLSLDELSRLVQTAGGIAKLRVIQNRAKADPAYLIGKGKAIEIAELARDNDIKTIVFDEELKPSQQKNLEELILAKIIDRTRLILDIFALRARSKEGKLQVEKAQLEYYLPRINKIGVELDNQVGGIGTRRGPGEKKLEIDQRRIRDSITALKRELARVKTRRDITRDSRSRAGEATVAIVGYTNAGKSTLLNALSGRNDIYADDLLFATLDPTTRRVKLPGGREVLFTDTVGFINKLPHGLVAAFRSTLEEIKSANCILHIIDASGHDYEKQAQTVHQVLEEIGASKIDTITIYNKADLLDSKRKNILERENAILISAKNITGFNSLLERVEKVILPRTRLHEVTLPYSDNKLISKIFQLANVKKQQFLSKSIKLEVETTDERWNKIKSILKIK